MPLVDTLPARLETIHIMGIAGTAMGALAGMLQQAGYGVTGSDTAPAGRVIAVVTSGLL